MNKFEYCVCGHTKKIHGIYSECEKGWYFFKGEGCECESFKLDNLRLIEELSKEKGLV